ncbi:MAG TPA: hypothetical protein VGD43_21305 [Micromonospora sp.]
MSTRHSCPIRPHRALRPLWLCRVCAAPWPCAAARLALRREYADDPVGLAVLMATTLHEAARDLYRLNPNPGPDPAALYRRFVRWTRYRPGQQPGV